MKKLLIALLGLCGASASLAADLLQIEPLPRLYQTETDALLSTRSPEIFGLLPYEQNYLMETYSNGNFRYPKRMRHDEIKFQISVALPIWRGIFGKNSVLAGSYTQTSWFQMSNVKDSAPFRETNYKPQLFVSWAMKTPLWGGWQLSEVESGVLHQSNGRDDLTKKSRSWNRIYTRLSATNGAWRVQLKPWWRIPEKAKDDDNPDIQDYRGHADVVIDYYTKTHQVHLKGHYNPRSGYGGVQLSYSYPLGKYWRIYAQYFGGYGESLIDYNQNIQRIGLGFSLNNVF